MNLSLVYSMKEQLHTGITYLMALFSPRPRTDTESGELAVSKPGLFLFPCRGGNTHI